MQNQINYGYIHIAQELHAIAAPVGPAWSISVKEHPELSLWQDDGSHPTGTGTYFGSLSFLYRDVSEVPGNLVMRRFAQGNCGNASEQFLLRSPGKLLILFARGL